MYDFVIVIPARLSSTRLPEKPLIEINGKEVLLRTYEQCCKAFSSELIFVATDHEKIYNFCINNHIQVRMTNHLCLTGTDRIVDFSNQVPARTYINVQGDEPLINPKDILRVIEFSKEYPHEIINGFAPINSEEDYNSIHIPKVVFRPDFRLLYMSRSPIPGNKVGNFSKAWRQICIYAFPVESLVSFGSQQQKSLLEEEEDIEILRFLELGYEVRMVELSSDSISVDTPDDVIKVKNRLDELESQ